MLPVVQICAPDARGKRKTERKIQRDKRFFSVWMTTTTSTSERPETHIRLLVPLCGIAMEHWRRRRNGSRARLLMKEDNDYYGHNISPSFYDHRFSFGYKWGRFSFSFFLQYSNGVGPRLKSKFVNMHEHAENATSPAVCGCVHSACP